MYVLHKHFGLQRDIIFSLIPVFIEYGGKICYASLAIDYYELGRKTGEMAAEILLGKKAPKDFEVATLTPSVVYNNDLCATLGIEVPEK